MFEFVTALGLNARFALGLNERYARQSNNYREPDGPYPAAPKEELQEGGFYLDREVVPVHVSTGWLTGTQYKDEAGWLLRTSIRPELSLLLLLRGYVWVSIHTAGKSCADVGRVLVLNQ